MSDFSQIIILDSLILEMDSALKNNSLQSLD